MQNMHFHVNENVRITMFVILFFGIIALVSYLQWAGYLG